MACLQSLAEHYSKAGFLKTYGNVSEAAKYLFKERLKARVTPTFYFFRNGKFQSFVQSVVPCMPKRNLYFFQSGDALYLLAMLLGYDPTAASSLSDCGKRLGGLGWHYVCRGASAFSHRRK